VKVEVASFIYIGALMTALVGGCDVSVPSHSQKSASPRRIVSLAPSATEMLFALGAGPEVVGVSQYCDYPPAARKLPQVGTFITPNIETIMALRPTLVIGPSISSNLRVVRALQVNGIATLMIDDDSVAAIEQSVQQIGDRIGRSNNAHRLVGEIRRRIDSVEERLRGVPARRVLMVVGHQPMVAVGRGTFLDELLTLSDSTNIGAASQQIWPRLSIEYVIASRPDVILDGAMGTDPSTPDVFWAAYPSIPAVKNHRVFGYPNDPTLHPGPRIWQTLEIIAQLIHPEAFRHAAPRRSAHLPGESRFSQQAQHETVRAQEMNGG
jgi:iron complex transport system substrate-binding protein